MGAGLKAKPTRAEIRLLRERKRAFLEAARGQCVCAACGATDSFDAHHVLYRQHLRDIGFDEWDARNALRLCDRYSRRRCHPRHHARGTVVRLAVLTDENIDYAFEVLGPYAADYLRRHYDGDDERVQRRLDACLPR